MKTRDQKLSNRFTLTEKQHGVDLHGIRRIQTTEKLVSSFTSEFDLNNCVAPTCFNAVSSPIGAIAGFGAGSTTQNNLSVNQ